VTWWSTVLELGSGGSGQQGVVGVGDEDVEVWRCESAWNLVDGHVTVEVRFSKTKGRTRVG